MVISRSFCQHLCQPLYSIRPIVHQSNWRCLKSYTKPICSVFAAQWSVVDKSGKKMFLEVLRFISGVTFCLVQGISLTLSFSSMCEVFVEKVLCSSGGFGCLLYYVVIRCFCYLKYYKMQSQVSICFYTLISKIFMILSLKRALNIIFQT